MTGKASGREGAEQEMAARGILDINRSESFSMVRGNEIIIGLSCVRGIPMAAVHAIISNRNRFGKFVSLADFIMRTRIPREYVETLIKAGAFDSIEANRRKLYYSLEELYGITALIMELKRTRCVEEAKKLKIVDKPIPDWEESIKRKYRAMIINPNRPTGDKT